MERKPGWKAISYILGNQIIERIATVGMMANFMVYLLQVFNLGQVAASNVLGVWTGVSNFIPIIGACVADAYLGKFRTIVLSSFGILVGMLIVILTAWVPQLHPPSCTSPDEECVPSTSTQLAILIVGLFWLAVGTGGIGPCTIPFAIDQFDTTSPKGRKGVNRFFNWYYTSQTVIQLISITVIVYLQNKNWILGFGVLAVLMLCSIIIFFAGANVYVDIPPEGTIFSSIAQVFVVAYKNRRLQIPEKEELGGVYYDPPLDHKAPLKMPLTKQLRCLNKAALIGGKELKAEGSEKNAWKLCSIEQVEEVKCLIKMLPIWASGILGMIPLAQQGTFPVSQALKMDRHVGPHLELPAASFNAVSLITVGIFLPCFDLFLQPALAKATKQEEGLTSLQKIAIGDVCAILTMVSAGLVEWRRRHAAISHGAPMSAMWLAPQYVLLGLCQMFTLVGHTQFYSTESPEKMRSVGNSLQYLAMAVSIYVGTLVVNVVHRVSSKRGGIDWLSDDINVGRLDYYYFVIAGLAALNLVYIFFCVKHYRYKLNVEEEEAVDGGPTLSL